MELNTEMSGSCNPFYWIEERRNIYEWSSSVRPINKHAKPDCLIHSKAWKCSFQFLVNKLRGSMLSPAYIDNFLVKDLCSCKNKVKFNDPKKDNNYLNSDDNDNTSGGNLPVEVLHARIEDVTLHILNWLNADSSSFNESLLPVRHILRKITEESRTFHDVHRYRFLKLIQGHKCQPFHDEFVINIPLQKMQLVRRWIRSLCVRYCCAIDHTTRLKVTSPDSDGMIRSPVELCFVVRTKSVHDKRHIKQFLTSKAELFMKLQLNLEKRCVHRSKNERIFEGENTGVCVGTSERKRKMNLFEKKLENRQRRFKVCKLCRTPFGAHREICSYHPGYVQSAGSEVKPTWSCCGATARSCGAENEKNFGCMNGAHLWKYKRRKTEKRNKVPYETDKEFHIYSTQDPMETSDPCQYEEDDTGNCTTTSVNPSVGCETSVKANLHQGAQWNLMRFNQPPLFVQSSLSEDSTIMVNSFTVQNKVEGNLTSEICKRSELEVSDSNTCGRKSTDSTGLQNTITLTTITVTSSASVSESFTLTTVNSLKICLADRIKSQQCVTDKTSSGMAGKVRSRKRPRLLRSKSEEPQNSTDLEDKMSMCKLKRYLSHAGYCL